MGTDVEQEGEQKRVLLKSGVDPREAARLRWEKSRAREADEREQAAAASSGRIILVRTPVHVGDIMAALQVKAKKGDAAASRQLLEWMREYPAEEDTDLSALDRRTRQDVIARLLVEIEEDEGQRPSAPLDLG